MRMRKGMGEMTAAEVLAMSEPTEAERLFDYMIQEKDTDE